MSGSWYDYQTSFTTGFWTAKPVGLSQQNTDFYNNSERIAHLFQVGIPL